MSLYRLTRCVKRVFTNPIALFRDRICDFLKRFSLREKKSLKLAIFRYREIERLREKLHALAHFGENGSFQEPFSLPSESRNRSITGFARAVF